MSKSTSIIFSCAEVLLLVSCSFAKLDATSTLSQQATLPPDAAFAATVSEVTLPPVYLITPMKVLYTEKYTEGVVFDREGNLYFSQTKAGTITVLAADGTYRIWTHVDGANGHKIMPDGTHIVAAQNSVVQLDTNGKLLKVVAKEFNGNKKCLPSCRSNGESKSTINRMGCA